MIKCLRIIFLPFLLVLVTFLQCTRINNEPAQQAAQEAKEKLAKEKKEAKEKVIREKAEAKLKAQASAHEKNKETKNSNHKTQTNKHE